jgi:diguanylate cyclase (GGDEF)-like protein
VLLIESRLDALPPDLFKKLSDLTDRLAVAVTHFDRAETLYRQAHFDPLTGLINRYAFEDRLKQAVRQSQREGTSGALLYIDLDRFKQVNDTEGHKAGDRLLLHVADRIKRCVRGNDTIARLGGDEFAIVVHKFDAQAELIRLCERVTAEIAKPLQVDRIEHSIDASIGVALFPMEGSSAEELLMRADAAMYRAKERSGGSFAFFDEQLNEVTRERVRMESRLRRALREEDLEVLFQPQLHLATHRVVAVEALLRWRDAELGEVSPVQFIPIAEETGLIRDIGPLVLKRAVAALERLRASGIQLERLSVNASAKEIASEGFAGRFVRLVRLLGASPQQFEVEVTESVFIKDASVVARELRALREEGVRVALDDFGTGYSSLNMLRTLPLDVIKIDRSFIVEVTQSQQARDLTRNIIQIARALDIGVVAEGTECDEEVSLLRGFGCDYVQGYGISRPLTLDELVLFVSNQPANDVPPPVRAVPGGR